MRIKIFITMIIITLVVFGASMTVIAVGEIIFTRNADQKCQEIGFVSYQSLGVGSYCVDSDGYFYRVKKSCEDIFHFDCNLKEVKFKNE